MEAQALLRLGLGVLCAWGLGCKREKPSENDDRPSISESAHVDEPAHGALPKRVHVSKQVIADAKIKTAPATRRTLDLVVDLPGEIAADPDRMAKVSSPIAGRIQQVSFVEGAEVK